MQAFPKPKALSTFSLIAQKMGFPLKMVKSVYERDLRGGGTGVRFSREDFT